MDRISGSTALANANGTGKTGFVDLDSALGIVGTIVTAAWLNAVQEELCNIVEQFGGQLDGANNAQVYQAIKAAIDKALPGGASETVAGLVELATIAEAKAGKDGERAVTPAGLAAAITAALPGSASETAPGIVELATIAETKAGKDGERAVTPAGLAAMLATLVLGTSAPKNTGTTVVDPGTGALEVASPSGLATGAAHTFGAADRGQQIRRSNSGAAMTDTLPGAGAILPNGWWCEVLNTDPLGNLSIVAASGASLDGGAGLILGPGQSAMVRSDGAAYWTSRGLGRSQLQADLMLYVAPTGSDAANSGLTAASPLATIQAAWNLLARSYDLNGRTVTIQLADGTYPSGLGASGPLVGQTGPSSVVIKGDSSSATAVVVSKGGFCAAAGASFTVRNLKVLSPLTENLIFATSCATINIIGIDFGATAGFHIAAQGGNVNLLGNYSISGGAAAHFQVSSPCAICYGLPQAVTITISGSPSFSYGFASVGNSGCLYIGNMPIFSGSVTGARYSVYGNGVIYTNGSGESYLPGSIAGTKATGGQYI
jgi:hypothetical protein